MRKDYEPKDVDDLKRLIKESADKYFSMFQNGTDSARCLAGLVVELDQIVKSSS